MMAWAHISEIPDDLRKAFFVVECRHRAAEDKLLEALVSIVREKRLAERIPDLVETAIASGIPTTQAIEAVTLVSGLSFPHCARLYYARRNQ